MLSASFPTQLLPPKDVGDHKKERLEPWSYVSTPQFFAFFSTNRTLLQNFGFSFYKKSKLIHWNIIEKMRLEKRLFEVVWRSWKSTDDSGGIHQLLMLKVTLSVLPLSHQSVVGWHVWNEILLWIRRHFVCMYLAVLFCFGLNFDILNNEANLNEFVN